MNKQELNLTDIIMAKYPNINKKLEDDLLESFEYIINNAISESFSKTPAKIRKLFKEIIEPEIELQMRAHLENNKDKIVKKIIDKQIQQFVKGTR